MSSRESYLEPKLAIALPKERPRESKAGITFNAGIILGNSKLRIIFNNGERSGSLSCAESRGTWLHRAEVEKRRAIRARSPTVDGKLGLSLITENLGKLETKHHR